MTHERRERTDFERVYDEIYDDKDGLVVRQDATEKTLKPIAALFEMFKWPARILIGALGIYLSAQVVRLLDYLPLLFGGS